MSDEKSPLDDLAAAVSDGRQVNWDAEASQTSNDLALDVQQLRVIAGIADLHRQLAHASQLETQEASVAETVLAQAPPQNAPRFGPLLIRHQLGSGAFGDVYRAWDTTLDREVALKVLRSKGRGSRADSIVREGQMLAKVSHPNVMAIFGAQEVDGQVGIWGEFLHGRTLTRMVTEDGPLSADEALVVGDAIARALAAAHRAGVLHRDVKAQNVIREKGGRIVLMDFGLGREFVRGAETTGQELAGTPLYLAPELFDGGRASPQSDLYSLGVLLFYLVTGTFPVKGASLEGIGDAHRQRERSRLQDLRQDLPTRFVQVVERALEPDPAKRFESAGAMQAALVSATQAVADDEPAPTGVRRWIAVIAAIALAVAAAGVTAFVLTRPGPDPGKYTVAIEPPAGTIFPDSSRSSPTISPDGKFIAFAAADSSAIHLWLHDMSRGQARMIEGSDNAQTPFWSADSQNVGFFDPSGVLRMVSVGEGSKPAGTTETAGEPRGAAWGATGVLLYPKGPRSGLYRRQAYADKQGPPETEVVPLNPGRGEIGLMWPQFLPDGERFIYFVFSTDAEVRGIYLGSLDGKTRTLLAHSDTSGVIVGDAIAFVQGGNLVSLPVDWSAGSALGRPQMFVPGVASTFDFQTVASAATDGTLAYFPAVESTQLIWFDRAGQQLGTLPLPPARYRNPAISFDGQLLAVQRFQDSLSRIEIYDLNAPERQKTSIAHSAAIEASAWGPGQQLFYASIGAGKSDIYVRDLAVDTPHELLYSTDPTDDTDKMPMDWSEPRKSLSFVSLDRRGKYSLWSLLLTKPARALPVNPGLGTQVGGRISPDGTRIVYTRRDPVDVTGKNTERLVWVSDFPSGANRFRINTGGSDPAWPSNGEVSFFNRNNRFTIVDARKPIGSGDAPETSSFNSEVRTPSASRNNYAWAPDGRRVLINVPATPPHAIRINVTVPRRPSNR